MKFYWIFIFPLVINLHAAYYDYVYPHTDPSFSNYGALGLLTSPNARFLEEGSLAFSWNRMQPYMRGSIIAYPFNWFEASYQYTDVNNKLYSESFAFSGNQTYKDKSFDIKLRLLQETDYLPAVAVGFRDLAGTGIFASEYLVSSKRINNFDLTFGIGWGTLSARNIRNPLISLDDSFKTRSQVEGTKGGEFTTGSYFSGPMGIFGGVEIYLPYQNGARLKIEYDGIDYSKEGFPPIIQEKKYNIGYEYPVSKNLSVKLGYIRGNTLNFGFSYKASFVDADSFTKIYDPPQEVEDAPVIKRENTRDPWQFYISALTNMQSSAFSLNEANIDIENKTLELSYAQNRHFSYVRATGRIVSILDKISPEYIESFKLTNINADLAMSEITISRDQYRRYKPLPIEGIHINASNVQPAIRNKDNYRFRPPVILPFYHYRIEPHLRSQLGGPDGFYFGDARIKLQSELIIQRNFNLQADASIGLVNNYDKLKLASDSVIPHVRSDVVKYLKQSEAFALDRLQANIFFNPQRDLYSKISLGLFEPMFGGIGGELLYRPFYGSAAIGVEAWWVKQRDYDQRFKFIDYETVTGHLNLYYMHEPSKILVTIKGGKFLAKDSGIGFDFSRRFASGMRTGIFFTLTDISREEFGEGSFDKGFYFHIPLESIIGKRQKGYTTFALRPVTRDGGAYLTHGNDLFGITDQASFNSIMRDWRDFYD